MQLYDKDLLSVQEVRELVEKAKTAQEELAGKSQQEVDRIVRACPGRCEKRQKTGKNGP